MVKDNSSDHITFIHCLVVLCLCSLHHWSRKRALPGVICLCTATRLWYPALWRSWQTIFDETGCSCPRLEFRVNWSAVAHLLCLSLQMNTQISRSWSMCFCPLLTFADDVFPSEFHADINFDTVAHETSVSWAVFVAEASTKGAPNNHPSFKVTEVSSCSHISHNSRQLDLCSIFMHNPKQAEISFA